MVQQMPLALEMAPSTQPRVTNQARHQSDQRWRAAFENSAIGVMMADLSGRLFAANSAFRKMLGYTESELYRLTFLDITFEDDRRTNLRLFRGLVEGMGLTISRSIITTDDDACVTAGQLIERL
jgi:PAS domain-containing protein